MRTDSKTCIDRVRTTWGAAIALVAFTAVSLGSARPAAAILRTGDLLVVAGGVIERVNPSTGSVSDFSPRAGSGTNLLVNPRDVTSDPEGEVFVTDSGHLFQIDVATGAQHEVRGFNPQIQGDYTLDLGLSPWGVAASAVAPSGLDGRTIYVGSLGALYEVDRTLLTGTSAQVFANFAMGFTNYEGQSVTTEDLGGGTPAAWVGTISGILSGGQGTLDAIYTESGPHIYGSHEIAGVTYVSQFFGTYCTDFPSDNGIYALAYDNQISGYVLSAYSTGGDLSCPAAIAGTAQPFALYIADRSQSPNRLIQVSGPQNPQTTPIATMPGSQVIEGLTVYAPEASGSVAAGAALAALLALAVRGRLSNTWELSFARRR